METPSTSLSIQGNWSAEGRLIVSLEAGLIAGAPYVFLIVFSPGGIQLVALDISDPVNPIETSAIEVPFGQWQHADELALHGTRLYAILTGQSTGIWIVDVSDPSAPRTLGASAIEGTFPGFRGLAVSGDMVYLAGYAGLKLSDNVAALPGKPGMIAVDVSDPVSPRITDSLVGSMFGSDARVIVEGTTAYLVGPTGLHLVDISNPSEAIEVGFIQIGGDPRLIEETVISASGDPRTVSRIVAAETAALDVAIMGEIAIVAAGAGGLRVISVSDTKTPYEIGSLPTKFAREVSVSRNRAYLRNRDRSLESASSVSVIDLAQPDESMLITSLEQATQVGGSVESAAPDISFPAFVRDLSTRPGDSMVVWADHIYLSDISELLVIAGSSGKED